MNALNFLTPRHAEQEQALVRLHISGMVLAYAAYVEWLVRRQADCFPCCFLSCIRNRNQRQCPTLALRSRIPAHAKRGC
jgi:hypothetical protein